MSESGNGTTPWTATLASSFDAHAHAHDRYRPGYPEEAVDLVVPQGVGTVLDLAAGTGKLTAAMLARGHRVIAVEPLPAMRAVLASRLPAADVRAGTAEQIPLPDAAVDAVVVGQAFHWFDPVPALDEVARVTRPGGTLGLLWNNDDDADPLVAAIAAALTGLGRPPGGSTGRGAQLPDKDIAEGDPARPPFRDHPGFTAPELRRVRWTWRGSVHDLLGVIHTYSYVIRAGEAAVERLDAAVHDLVNRLGRDGAALGLPVVCQVWRSTRR